MASTPTAKAWSVWEWVTSGPGVRVPGRSELVQARKYFRGQTKSWHGFTSSLYRVCKTAVGADVQVDEAHLDAAEREVIKTLREEGMGRRMSDGELLMVCQHHLIPTRLIDVSTKPLEALFFAVEKEDGTDGRLFVVAPHQTGSGLPQSYDPIRLARPELAAGEVRSPEPHPLPWARQLRGKRQSTEKWSIQVRLVSESPLDPRMRAQAGKFLVGGVHRHYSGLRMAYPQGYRVEDVTNVERPDISSLAINFAPGTGNERLSQAWRASGWTVRIHAAWKAELRDRLSKLKTDCGIEDITFDSIYPPVVEIERLGKHVAKQGVERFIHG
ncbi:FRG domain-containing protein [Gordonia amicalis]|uniref:FRG domain-containing protein n=1 Tax=Gordonia amicalis TaxID=89053 RepID=UPI00200A8C06|nr:FRG domain-containing protein [Gordonia amicalis]UPW15028.1 FRG domain-containing protein [Gordonia amicalis]